MHFIRKIMHACFIVGRDILTALYLETMDIAIDENSRMFDAVHQYLRHKKIHVKWYIHINK